MTWQLRLVKKDKQLTLYEVYHNEEGVPLYRMTSPCKIILEETERRSDMVYRIQRAFSLDVIKEEDLQDRKVF